MNSELTEFSGGIACCRTSHPTAQASAPLHGHSKFPPRLLGRGVTSVVNSTVNSRSDTPWYQGSADGIHIPLYTCICFHAHMHVHIIRSCFDLSDLFDACSPCEEGGGAAMPSHQVVCGTAHGYGPTQRAISCGRTRMTPMPRPRLQWRRPTAFIETA